MRLVIEVDGGYHLSKEQKEKDKIRDQIMQGNGLRVLRFTNEEVLEDVKSVLGRIQVEVDEILG